RQAVSFLKGQLRPVASADPRRIAQLIADLDSDHAIVRDKASRELERLGELAEPALRQARAGQPSPELCRRVDRFLEGLRCPVTDPERLRALRAVAALEHIGSPGARRLLADLAKGAPQ